MRESFYSLGQKVYIVFCSAFIHRMYICFLTFQPNIYLRGKNMSKIDRLIDWLIDRWIAFYAVSAIFQPCNGGDIWPVCQCQGTKHPWIKSIMVEERTTPTLRGYTATSFKRRTKRVTDHSLVDFCKCFI